MLLWWQASIGVKDTGRLSFMAFGGFGSFKEKKEVLGILSLCLFSGKTPEGSAVFPFLWVESGSPHYPDLSDNELQDIILRAFHDMLKFPLHKEPDMIRIFRHNTGNPSI